jgi:hypothetical protein
MSELAAAVRAEAQHELADEFYRYLNFFEHLASLRELGQISKEEVLTLFEYDLALVSQHPFVVQCLARQGFERLPQLLRDPRLTRAS